MEGGDTAHTLLRWGHCTYLIGVGTPHIPYWGGDTAHSLLGWGHCTTLKEISLSTKFHVCISLPSGRFWWGLLLLRYSLAGRRPNCNEEEVTPTKIYLKEVIYRHGIW